MFLNKILKMNNSSLVHYHTSRKPTKADIFLFEFTRELINNSGYKRRKVSVHYDNPIFGVSPISSHFEDSLNNNFLPANVEEESEEKKQINDENVQKSQESLKESPMQEANKFQELKNPIFSKNIQIPIQRNIRGFANYESFSFDKFQNMLQNKGIVSIECPGPEKFVSVRRADGKQIVTKIILTKEDIENVLNYFSDQSMIPRIGGVFKAIIGNLIITAIDSDIAGPRFIVSKVIQRKSRFVY